MVVPLITIETGELNLALEGPPSSVPGLLSCPVRVLTLPSTVLTTLIACAIPSGLLKRAVVASPSRAPHMFMWPEKVDNVQSDMFNFRMTQLLASETYIEPLPSCSMMWGASNRPVPAAPSVLPAVPSTPATVTTSPTAASTLAAGNTVNTTAAIAYVKAVNRVRAFGQMRQAASPRGISRNLYFSSASGITGDR
eukprot:scaffold240862_cov42-Prasinocladus_malaysianus.AAC.1